MNLTNSFLAPFIVKNCGKLVTRLFDNIALNQFELVRADLSAHKVNVHASANNAVLAGRWYLAKAAQNVLMCAHGDTAKMNHTPPQTNAVKMAARVSCSINDWFRIMLFLSDLDRQAEYSCHLQSL